MSEFSIIRTAIWNDPAFIELDTDARLLFVWAWTNPQAAIGGLYALERPVGAAERPAPGLRWDTALMLTAFGAGVYGATAGSLMGRLEDALIELEAKPLLLYDESARVIWVPSRCANSCRSLKAAKIIVKEFNRCPSSPLRDGFYARYGQMLGLE